MNNTVYYVWLLDFESGKTYRFTTIGTVAEDDDALTELLFETLGFSEPNCQWMVTTDGKFYEEVDLQ